MSESTPTYQSTGYRFIAVLNKKYETGRLLNVLGHITAGLISLHKDDLKTLDFTTYVDADGNKHKAISDNPFIVLKADNGNKLRALRTQLLEKNIAFTDFTNTMINGSAQQQHEGTLQTKEADLDYLGVCFFADNETARELTKKFSLFS